MTKNDNELTQGINGIKAGRIREFDAEDRKKQARIRFIRAKLIEGEQSGFSNKTPNEILTEIKKRARKDGLIK